MIIIIIDKQDRMEVLSTNGDQPKLSVAQQPLKSTSMTMIQLPQQLGCNRFCASLSKVKTTLLAQLFRTGIYILVAFGIFVAFERTNHIALHQESYFSSQQVVYPSQIRGLFPPIQGLSTNLLGKWTVSFTNSREIGTNDIFSNYSMEFKTNNALRIKRVGCDGDLIMRWQTFQFNIYLSDYNPSTPDKQMIIQPDQNDIKCIKNNSTFFNHLESASVWTLFQRRLYILIQQWKNNRNAQSILLLEKK